MRAALLLIVVALAPLGQAPSPAGQEAKPVPQGQEAKPVPKDSVEIVTPGCLKGRVFTATPRPEGEGAMRGPNVTGHHFRVNGPHDVMDLVKAQDGHLVEVTGIVKRSALGSEGLGVKVGGTRMVFGAPGGDPGHMAPPTPGSNVPVMDVSNVRFLDDSCPIK